MFLVNIQARIHIYSFKVSLVESNLVVTFIFRNTNNNEMRYVYKVQTMGKEYQVCNPTYKMTK